ncbi:hypothetical protein HIM_07088 [Hirsutella minnesotensis 3608]|uniref:HCNGP-like protein n=1 Tax=Hirsutella minnesotensis 3608 TaxID=1043627 RepID=A0A0F7ZZ35_9HYPO|nr:hypothetical protein HIM_07088 [Hirsutella minnesotensis 3608]
MAGLVGYDSSDDEEKEVEASREGAELTPDEAPVKSHSTDTATEENQSKPAPPAAQPQAPPAIGPVPQSAVPLGPSLPPMDSSAVEGDGTQEDDGPSSPYSANRALVHDLTLPTIPDLDIPRSPPGSPPERARKSFEQFLALKKKGTHFNAKLEQSTALRNPSVTDKLMDFVGLDNQQQYETTLPRDLWNPAAFPETAFVDKLRKSRDKIAKEREADKASARGFIDFAPSTMTGDASAPASGGLAKVERSKSSWK